jgi:hypothetical protein
MGLAAKQSLRSGCLVTLAVFAGAGMSAYGLVLRGVEGSGWVVAGATVV